METSRAMDQEMGDQKYFTRGKDFEISEEGDLRVDEEICLSVFISSPERLLCGRGDADDDYMGFRMGAILHYFILWESLLHARQI